MRRLALLVLLFVSAVAAAQDRDSRIAAIAYLQKLQQSDGSFRITAPAESFSLRATSSAIRALHYLGASVERKDACTDFVSTCFDRESGSFADRPGGKPDVFTTAVGLMAVVELQMPLGKYAPKAAGFLSSNAKSFDEIRIAVAGFEAIKEQPPNRDAWLAEVKKGQNADGTFGKGPGQARETGSRVVALLRLRAKIENRAAIVKAIREGQRPDGGFGKGDAETSDLETTYRVMRCLYMLKASPRVADLRALIAKCQNADGGYGVAPGQPSSVSGTYYAAIILHWLGQHQVPGSQ